MPKAICLVFLLFITVPVRVLAQEAPVFPKGAKSPNVHHVGDVWLNELNAPDSVFSYSVAFATFAPDARLDWHTHPGGQILLMTDGIGYYQEKGKARRTVHQGDVIKCLPGVEHWHGATPTTGVSYLATTPAQKGKTIWLHKVTDEDYYGTQTMATASNKREEKVLAISRNKWRWMSERQTDSLSVLFHEAAVFVHMGGNMTKMQELEVIRSGGIQYKQVDIQETSVRFADATAILLSKIRLVAVVGGNEVINPFTVTEVYVEQEGGIWKLASLSFTRLLTPP